MKLSYIATILILFSQMAFSKELIKIGFAGDVLVHDALYKSVLNKQSFSSLWKKAIPLFNKADYMVVNLEGPAALGVDKSGRSQGDVGFTYDLNIYSGTKFSFNYHPQILVDLKDSGVDLVGVANNHSMDRLSRGVESTLIAAKNVGLPTTGAKMIGSDDTSFVHLAGVKGYNIAFIACTESTNGIPDKLNQVLKCFDQKQNILKLIRETSSLDNVDAVIVLPHWGTEYASEPNTTQKKWARLFLEAGATAVIGSHPHVLQPWESYRTQDGRNTLIAYSLGNLLAFQAGVEKKTGAVVYLHLQPDGRGKLEFVTSTFVPTYRDGYEVFPVKNKQPREAYQEAVKKLGASNLVEP